MLSHARVSEYFVQGVDQLVGALPIVGRATLRSPLQEMEFVGDVQCGQYGQTNGIDSIGLLGDGTHLGIDVFGEFENVIRIGTAEIVALIENLHAYAAVVGVFHRILPRRRCHKGAPRFSLVAFDVRSCSAGDLLADAVDLAQHLLYTPAYFLAVLSQLDGLATQGFHFLLALLELLTQALHIALGRSLGLPCGLVQFNSAINLLFKCLEIVDGNLGRYLFYSFENHGELHPLERIANLSAVYPRMLWKRCAE